MPMGSPDRSALVLYGTETGTAQDLAHEVSRTLRRLHFATIDVIPLDDLPQPTTLNHYDLSVFVVATTGQGDFPDNARLFWKSLLRKKLGPETLKGVRCALVGLGDTSYLKFNWAGRKLGKRLRQLGAEDIVEACEADEQGDEGIDGYFLEWLKGFREKVLELWPLPGGQEPIPEDVPIPDRWRLHLADEATNGHTTNDSSTTHPQAPSASPSPSHLPNSFSTTLELNARTTPSTHFQDVRLLKLSANGQHPYLPGDALAMLPQNSPSDVTTLLTLMSWAPIADHPITLHDTCPPSSAAASSTLTKPPLNPTTTLTLRSLLTTYLDITAIPRRSFFATLARYTSNPMHRERLLEFTDPQYLDEYFDYATRPRRGILEVLQEFDSVHVPWEECLGLFPVLRARLFSLASAYKDEEGKEGGQGTTEFELLVAIVRYKTVLKRVREGVCTRYLAGLEVGTKLQVSLRTEGRIASSRDLGRVRGQVGRSYVLVGPGTGIAPLRGLVLAQREAGRRRTEEEGNVLVAEATTATTTTLIFGARNKEADYFFAEDWEELVRDGAVPPRLNLITAFSRDQQRKIYVQDRIREHAATLAPLMRDENTVVVVCGSSGAMPKAVRAALADALMAVPATDELDLNRGRQGTHAIGDEAATKKELGEAAEAFLAQMEREGRYKQETWS